MIKRVVLLIIVLALLAAALWGPIVSRVEQPHYDVVESEGAIELRHYEPMIVAETQVSGKRKEAINAGFRLIADYIFGNNVPAEKVAMTAPVTQQQTEKIAMTAPVTQQGANDNWTIRFVMPAHYKLETLPKPNNNAVRLLEIPGKHMAVIRFSGLAGEETLAKRTEELMAYVRSRNLTTAGEAIHAYYNPPWTLPFLRRNEVMIEVLK